MSSRSPPSQAEAAESTSQSLISEAASSMAVLRLCRAGLAGGKGKQGKGDEDTDKSGDRATEAGRWDRVCFGPTWH
jgi:hypothetical protein